MHYMRFPLENIDDILVLQYGEERMLVSMNLTTKEERYGDMLRFVREEWGIGKEEVVFETDEHPLCNGKRIKMHMGLFVPHITSLIGTIYVSKKATKAEEEAPIIVTVEDRPKETAATASKEGTTSNMNTISRLLELTDLAIDRDNATEKGSSDEATIMIDRDDVDSVASEESDSSEESAPYDTLADSTASIAHSEDTSHLEESQRYDELTESMTSVKSTGTENDETYGPLGDSAASIVQSEQASEAEESEATTTAPGSPAFSEERLSMQKPVESDYKMFIRIYKNVTTSPPVVFRVKANQTVQSVFNRACHFFNFHPSLSAIYRSGSNMSLFTHMHENMKSVCAQGGGDFIIYGCSAVGDRVML